MVDIVTKLMMFSIVNVLLDSLDESVTVSQVFVSLNYDWDFPEMYASLLLRILDIQGKRFSAQKRISRGLTSKTVRISRG